MHKRHTEADHQVAKLEIAPQRRQATDLARHHERLDLPLQPERLLAATPVRSAFPEPFDFDVADGLGDPLGGARLRRPEEDLGRGLRQHRFGVVAVPGLELTAALEPEHDGVVGLAVLGDRGVQLRQALETRQLVEDEPRASGMGLALVHQAQDERVEPEADQRHQARPRFRGAREKEPAGAAIGPRRGTPSTGGVALRREQQQGVRHHVQGGEDPAALRRRLAIDHGGVRRAGEAPIEFLLMAQPERELLRRRPQREEIREDATGPFGEERVLVVAIREQRGRERQRLRLMAPLVARTPKRAAGIERIENHVVPVRPVELPGVFQCGVVHDRGLATGLELLEDLANEGGLAGPRIAHDQQVTRFDRAGHAEPSGPPMDGRLPEPDALGPEPPRELGNGHEFGPFEPAAMTTRPRPGEVHAEARSPRRRRRPPPHSWRRRGPGR